MTGCSTLVRIKDTLPWPHRGNAELPGQVSGPGQTPSDRIGTPGGVPFRVVPRPLWPPRQGHNSGVQQRTAWSRFALIAVCGLIAVAVVGAAQWSQRRDDPAAVPGVRIAAVLLLEADARISRGADGARRESVPRAQRWSARPGTTPRRRPGCACPQPPARCPAPSRRHRSSSSVSTWQGVVASPHRARAELIGHYAFRDVRRPLAGCPRTDLAAPAEPARPGRPDPWLAADLDRLIRGHRRSRTSAHTRFPAPPWSMPQCAGAVRPVRRRGRAPRPGRRSAARVGCDWRR